MLQCKYIGAREHCRLQSSLQLCMNITFLWWQERLAMLKQQQEEAASRECTFHPVINHRSDRLMAERSEVLRVRRTLQIRT